MTYAEPDLSDGSGFGYRSILPTWPDSWRQRWGELANILAEQGTPWPEDERRAFREVAAEFCRDDDYARAEREAIQSEAAS